MACGRLMPDMMKNSNTLSREAESLMSGCTIGDISATLPNVSEESTLSLAFIQLRLPRIVLISPLWHKKRKGCAKLHVGKVFVLNRECTKAIPLVRYSLDKSGKYSLNCVDESIPLYMMVLLDKETM